MKAITSFKSLAVGLSIALILAALTWVIANAADDALNPDAQAALERAVSVPERAALAHRYLLGLHAREDEDPATVGADLHLLATAPPPPEAELDTTNFRSPNALKVVGFSTESQREHFCGRSSFYCLEVLGQDQLKELDQKVDRLLSENSVLLARFEHLLDFGAYGADWSPSLTNPHVNAFEFLSLVRIKLLSIGRRLREGERQLAANELLRLHRFLAHSLQYPSSMVEGMVQLVALKNVRGFVQAAKSDDPKLFSQSHLAMGDAFKVDVTFETFVLGVMSTEMRMFNDILARDYPLGVWLETLISPTGDGPSGVTRSFGGLGGGWLLVKTNASLNRYYETWQESRRDPCVAENAMECVTPSAETLHELESFSIRNSMGKKIIQAFGFDHAPRLQEARQFFQEFAEPI